MGVDVEVAGLEVSPVGLLVVVSGLLVVGLEVSLVGLLVLGLEFEELLDVVGSLVGSWVSEVEVLSDVSEVSLEVGSEVLGVEVELLLRMSWLSVTITAILSVLPSPISTFLKVKTK